MIIIVNLRLFQDYAVVHYNLGPYALSMSLPVMVLHDIRMKPVYGYSYQVPCSEPYSGLGINSYWEPSVVCYQDHTCCQPTHSFVWLLCQQVEKNNLVLTTLLSSWSLSDPIARLSTSRSCLDITPSALALWSNNGCAFLRSTSSSYSGGTPISTDLNNLDPLPCNGFVLPSAHINVVSLCCTESSSCEILSVIIKTCSWCACLPCQPTCGRSLPVGWWICYLDIAHYFRVCNPTLSWNIHSTS